MRNFQQKGKWKRLLESKLALYALGLFVVFFAWNVFGFVGKMEDTIKNRKIAEAKVAGLRAQKESLSIDVERLQTDTGVEETIRDKFGLVKEGEDVIVVVDEKETDLPLVPEKKGFFSFFTRWFE